MAIVMIIAQQTHTAAQSLDNTTKYQSVPDKVREK